MLCKGRLYCIAGVARWLRQPGGFKLKLAAKYFTAVQAHRGHTHSSPYLGKERDKRGNLKAAEYQEWLAGWFVWNEMGKSCCSSEGRLSTFISEIELLVLF